MSKNLQKYNEEELLNELLKRNQPVHGLKKLEFTEPAYCTDIAIGDDHTAQIALTVDDYETLKQRQKDG